MFGEIKPDIIIKNVDVEGNSLLFWVKEDNLFEFAFSNWKDDEEQTSAAMMIDGELHYNHDFRNQDSNYHLWDFDDRYDLVPPRQIANILYNYVNKIDDILSE